MNKFYRIIKHSFSTGIKTRRLFPKKTLKNITESVKKSELQHRGEIRVCIESSLSPAQIIRGMTGRERAVDIFSLLRVWDTEENNGVLIYILVADHDIEILADRGVLKNAPENFWNSVCSEIELKFKEHKFEEGILQAVEHIGLLLQNKYPRISGKMDINELPDSPHVI